MSLSLIQCKRTQSNILWLRPPGVSSDDAAADR